MSDERHDSTLSRRADRDSAPRDWLLRWAPTIAIIISCAVMLMDRWRGDGAAMQAVDMRISANTRRVERVEGELGATREDTGCVRDELRKLQTSVVQLSERVTALIERLDRAER